MADPLSVPSTFEFHHVGYATTSIVEEQAFFEQLGYRSEGEPFSDPVQGVAGRFLVGSGPRIELLENLPGSRTLTPWIDAGVRMYHFGYWVDDIDDALQWARSRRGRISVQPVPAVAFGGRRIAFVIFRTRMMLEFIERHVPGAFNA